MRKIIVSVILFSFALSIKANDIINFDNPDNTTIFKDVELPSASYRIYKIVGGIEATKGEFPFLVSLQSSYYRHYCAGSLIKPNWVLTAAHCVDGITPSYIVTGLYKLSDTSGVEKIKPRRIIKHPNWNSKIMDYDYALIELSTNSKYTTIPLNTDSSLGNVYATVAGWGKTSEGGNFSSVLMKVSVPLVSKKTCDKAYPGKITNRMICAGYADGGKDSCQGDSGGPLIYNGKLIGVVSWGKGCARPGKYGVYSKVAAVKSWIDSTTQTTASSTEPLPEEQDQPSNPQSPSIWDWVGDW